MYFCISQLMRKIKKIISFINRVSLVLFVLFFSKSCHKPKPFFLFSEKMSVEKCKLTLTGRSPSDYFKQKKIIFNIFSGVFFIEFYFLKNDV